MSHCVPDFERGGDYSIPTTSTLSKESGEDEIMELLWQNNGPVVVQPHNQRSLQKTHTTAPRPQPPPPPPPNNQLYMEEDEMAAWLHYPLEEFYSEVLYPNPPLSTPTAAERPPQSPPRWPVPPAAAATASRGFQLFSRMIGNSTPELPASSGMTAVGSSNTPNLAPPAVAASKVVTRLGPAGGRSVGESLNVGDGGGEAGMRSSLSVSGSATSSATAKATDEVGEERGEKRRKVEGVDRKRKGRDNTDESFTANDATTTKPQTVDVENESADDKKHSGRGSTGTKRSRAAEIHNLSERRRRDSINEKMKALQELVPHCSKSDKASMLDDAIDYLKSLQMQVQMMSMGCGMVPVMFPGMQQQYMPPMGMGMGMGIDMGMTRQVMPLATTISGHVLPPAPPANMVPGMAPRLPLPPFAAPSLPAPHLSGNQTGNQVDSRRSSYAVQSSLMAQHPNMADPYQQYLAFQQMQMQMHMQAVQSQALSEPGSSKPTSSKGGDGEDTQ